MEDKAVESVRLTELAGQMKVIYDDFTEGVKNLGNKAKGHQAGNSKVGNSLLHWIAGGHITTARDQLCEDFLTKVKGQLELFQTALEGASPQERAGACGVLADIMLAPITVKSNATTDLMKRAMASQFKPFLPYLDREKLRECRDRFQEAYKPREMLPVEKELVKEMERLLKSS